MPAESPLISIVIVNYNGVDLLRSCLRSVFAQPYRPIEVIVVDNASRDGSVGMVRKEFDGVQVLSLQRNTGFAEGNNIGVRNAKGEFVVLLNNDATVEEDWLFALLRTMNDPGVALVASKVLTEGVPAEFYTMNGTINYLGYNIMRQFADLSKIFYAGGTSLMFRRSIVGEPFIAEYFLYHEDVYLSWRMRLRGYDIRMAQDSIVRHRGSATTRRASSSIISFYQVRNRFLNLFLFYRSGTLVRILPLLLLDAAVTLARSAFGSGKSLWGVLHAYGWLLLNGGWIVQRRRQEQAARRIPDDAILSLMSADVIDAARSGARLGWLNHLSRLYARLVGLPFHG